MELGSGESISEEKVTQETVAISLLVNIKTVAANKREKLQKQASKHHNPQLARQCLRNKTLPVVQHACKIFPSVRVPPLRSTPIHIALQELTCVEVLPPCHLSITSRMYHLSPSFPPISFLRHLAKGCKYFLLQALQAWDSSPLPALNASTLNSPSITEGSGQRLSLLDSLLTSIYSVTCCKFFLESLWQADSSVQSFLNTVVTLRKGTYSQHHQQE